MPISYDSSRPIYIHAINKLRSSDTEGLFSAMAQECLPLYAEHGIHLHSCWSNAIGQGQGPETIEVWEIENFDSYSAFLAANHSGKGDPRLAAWRRMRDEWINSSDEMLCLPHPKSPTIAELKAADMRAKLIVHEFVHTAPSMQPEYLDGVYRLWGKVAQAADRTVLGLYYSPWNNRRAINIWGIGREWDDLPVWNSNFSYDSDEFKLWMTMGHALRDNWDDRFMVPAPFSVAR
jgi:hypothetical protein